MGQVAANSGCCELKDDQRSEEVPKGELLFNSVQDSGVRRPFSEEADSLRADANGGLQCEPLSRSYRFVTVPVRHRGTEGLGLLLRSSPKSTTLVVEKVEGQLFREWNMHHQSQVMQVEPNDHLIDVGEVRGSAQELEAALLRKELRSGGDGLPLSFLKAVDAEKFQLQSPWELPAFVAAFEAHRASLVKQELDKVTAGMPAPAPAAKSRQCESPAASLDSPGAQSRQSCESFSPPVNLRTLSTASRPPVERVTTIARLLGLVSSAKNKSPEPDFKEKSPVLLHFDVNKTVISSDSVSVKSAEDGVRESVADLFWGFVSSSKDADGKEVLEWEWSGDPPCLQRPPTLKDKVGCEVLTYLFFCKKKHKADKALCKKMIKSFQATSDARARKQMEEVTASAVNKLRLPQELLDNHTSEKLKSVGLHGDTHFIVPALFHLVATLQRSGRRFGVLFRSFGEDHGKIAAEWNSFCEMKHPLFARLLEDIGPMDGTQAHVPDRRVHRVHTMYRDAIGPMLILDSFTNGPKEKSWDSWARTKPKPKDDSRGGRKYVKDTLKAEVVDGYADLQMWMTQHLMSQATGSIKDDWAWWNFNNEDADAGKLLPELRGTPQPRQVFFDDNIELDGPRIVDVRGLRGEVLPGDMALKKGMCVKVNPVEAVLNEEYFYQKLVNSDSLHNAGGGK